MRHLLPTLIVAAVLLQGACGEDDDTSAPAPVTATAEIVGDGGALVHPEIELPAQGRESKRLTVSMLAESLPVVAGDDEAGEPVTWRLGNQEALGTVENFGLFDRTLGRPDYVSVTSELTEPSALYVKFMGDMARDVCKRILTADYKKAEEDRIFARYAPLVGDVDDTALRANLRYLKLRFWGEYVPEGEAYDDQVAGLEGVFDAVTSAGEGTVVAWNAVCVTLLTSPAFHLY